MSAPAPSDAGATAPATTAAVHCLGLQKTYSGGVEAVRGLDLEIAAGECFGMLGPNGAGKTTTIEILEGLLPPSAGRVEIFGLAWRGHARQLRQWIGCSLQETRLGEKLTVRETLGMFASFYRYPVELDWLIAEFELTEKAHTWVGRLSGGQRQRLAVATALVGAPRLLFLDEPTTGLDPHSRLQLWQVIAQYQARGGTILLTTHYMEEAERLCNRVAILDAGRILALDTPAALIRAHAGDNGSLEDVFLNLTGHRLREET